MLWGRRTELAQHTTGVFARRDYKSTEIEEANGFSLSFSEEFDRTTQRKSGWSNGSQK